MHRTGWLFLLFISASLVSAEGTNGTVFLRGNQMGYRPGDSKIIVAFSKEPMNDHFEIYETGAVGGRLGLAKVFSGKAKVISAHWGRFQHHVELDFSALKKPGKYVLHLTGAHPENYGEIPITIAETAYAPLPDELLEFMREQQCGYNPFLNKECHQYDGRTADGPLTNGSYLNCTGGWHDAGDLLKYLLTSGNATAQMLQAYEMGKDKASLFADKYDARGKVGANGVPDILDEARWGLEWMLKLHPAPDQLYHQVADDRDHKGWRLPHEETADYGWGPGSNRVVYFADGKPQGLREYKSESTGIANLAGRYAAAMALGYKNFQKIDPAFAEKCLQAGKEVYAMGRAKEGVQQGNSYGAPYRYAETTWADDMEWGAAELFAVTKAPDYLADAKRYAVMAGSESWMGKEQTGHYQYYPFYNTGHFVLSRFVDGEFKKKLAGYYREGIERCIAMGQKNPYRAGVPFIWCSNNLLVALTTQGLLYERMTGDHMYHEFIVKQRDWLLGRNPWGTSMFTGIPEGGIFPHDPHLMTTKITGRPVRGGLVDGPVYERIFKALKGVSAPENEPFAAFQSELAVYHDTVHDYSSNEPTMDGTASAILMWVLSN